MTIYFFIDIPFIWERTYEVYIQTIHWWICRCCEAMSMNKDLQCSDFLTTGTVSDQWTIWRPVFDISKCHYQLENVSVYVPRQSDQLLSCATCLSLNEECHMVWKISISLGGFENSNILQESQYYFDKGERHSICDIIIDTSYKTQIKAEFT